MGWGDKPPWLSWRRALPYIQKGERPPWKQPRVRPEHESMLAALRNAQNYIRDSDGKVVILHQPSTRTTPTSPTVPTTDPDLPAQQPATGLDHGTKAQTAAAADHERRQQSNPYHLPPHLRPPGVATSTPQANNNDQRAGKQTKAADRTLDPKPASAAPPGDAEPPRGERPPQRRAVRFHLPDDHCEHPPKPTRYRTALRKLEDSTSIQLRIDGVMHNPVIVVENRPAYMIPEIAHPDPRPSAHLSQPEHGELLFFQPPVLRRQNDPGQVPARKPRDTQAKAENPSLQLPSQTFATWKKRNSPLRGGTPPPGKSVGPMETTRCNPLFVWGPTPKTSPGSGELHPALCRLPSPSTPTVSSV